MKLILQLMPHAISYTSTISYLSVSIALYLRPPPTSSWLTSSTFSPTTLLKSSFLLSTSPLSFLLPSASVLPPCYHPPFPSIHKSPTFSPKLAVSLCSSHAYSTSIGFLTTCPFLSLSVPPSLHLSRPSALIWTDVSAELIIASSCCLPTATCFPSCVAVPLSPFLSASPCHSHPLSPLRHLSLYHAYSPLLLSRSFPPISFPSETGLSGRFSHLSTRSLMLFCLHAYVCMCCTLWWVHICVYVCEWQRKGEGEGVCAT